MTCTKLRLHSEEVLRHPVQTAISNTHKCFRTAIFANSPNVISFDLSITSCGFGCINIASVFLATALVSGLALGPLTKCGTALNAPLVMICSASPVWNATQLDGMSTLIAEPFRDRMYRPAAGSGDLGRKGKTGTELDVVGGKDEDSLT